MNALHRLILVTIGFEYCGKRRILKGKKLEFSGVHITFCEQSIHVCLCLVYHLYFCLRSLEAIRVSIFFVGVQVGGNEVNQGKTFESKVCQLKKGTPT